MLPFSSSPLIYIFLLAIYLYIIFIFHIIVVLHYSERQVPVRSTLVHTRFLVEFVFCVVFKGVLLIIVFPVVVLFYFDQCFVCPSNYAF